MPRCPVQMHFGANDTHIPMSDIEIMRQKQPQAEIYVYQHAGHGFHCDERGSYDQPSSRIAWERTLGFLSRGFDSTAPEMDEPLKAAPTGQIAKQSAASGAKKKSKSKTKAKAKPAAKKSSKKKSKKKAAKKAAKKSKSKAKKKSAKKSKKSAKKKKSKKRR
jgi:sRNA-binding protein